MGDADDFVAIGDGWDWAVAVTVDDVLGDECLAGLGLGGGFTCANCDDGTGNCWFAPVDLPCANGKQIINDSVCDDGLGQWFESILPTHQ